METTPPHPVAEIKFPFAESKPPVTSRENSRAKTTFNLQNIGKPVIKAEEKKAEEQKVIPPVSDKPVDQDALKKAWNEFTALRKNQLAEYQLLKRGYVFKENKLIVTLDNPIEEPFLQGIRTSLIAYLRDKLSNSSLLVVGILREVEATRPMIYTNKEKFEYLLEKNPALKELQERFGLDADY